MRASTARPYTPDPRGRCRREIAPASRGRYRWKIPPRLLHPCRGEHRSPVPPAAGALCGRASLARPSGSGGNTRASTARPYTPDPRGRCRREIAPASRGRYRWKIPPRLLHPCRGEHRSPVPLTAGALCGRALLAPTTLTREGGVVGKSPPPREGGDGGKSLPPREGGVGGIGQAFGSPSTAPGCWPAPAGGRGRFFGAFWAGCGAPGGTPHRRPGPRWGSG